MWQSVARICLVGLLLPLQGTQAAPTVEAIATSQQQQLIARELITTYNVSFDSEEFDNLGDLDWRPIPVPFEGLDWKGFEVGANKHFFQTSGGKNAFTMIPINSVAGQILSHTPALLYPDTNSTVNDTNWATGTWAPNSMQFGCALHSGIPVECTVKFTARDKWLRTIASVVSKFTPPHARLNDQNRLEAGKAPFQTIRFDDKLFKGLNQLDFQLQNFSVLYTPVTNGIEDEIVDVRTNDAVLFVIDGVSYSTKSVFPATLAPKSPTETDANEQSRELGSAMQKGYLREPSHPGNQYSYLEDNHPPLGHLAARNSNTAVNHTFVFTNPANVDAATGDFPLSNATTKPFVFDTMWRGHSQNSKGDPQRNVFFNNVTWPFSPVSDSRLNFAYTETPWAARGSAQWSTIYASIRAADHTKFNLKGLSTACHPAFITAEDKSRLGMLDNDFECHFTVLGFKANFTEEPAEHAVDVSVSDWRYWREARFPNNFKDLDILEFHVTYASTRNVRIFVDNIQYELS
ncbi:hypothetical protein DRE_04148 [Drechslerella stenobrocha 248]|uniref:Uncharacterized protein n=1 Tax=Drechslerella stenobrocha 248 TaxID=1043628 RepID=W7HRJ3_9PEZI|nr:hypothetical protein DRE_04148 [Drechslerella stenobrocha 248]